MMYETKYVGCRFNSDSISSTNHMIINCKESVESCVGLVNRTILEFSRDN